jgi:cytoskeletal protein CcmA (bactofilin family)
MKKLSVMLLALLTTFVVASPARAADFQSGNSYSLGAEETVADDLYVGAQDITIDGTVERSAYLAARSITVTGEIKGDLNAVAETIKVTGKVDGSMHVAGSSVTITGQVGRDVFTATAQTIVDSKAIVGGSLVSGSGQLDLDGKVMKDLRSGTSTVNLRGSVAGNAYVASNQMTFGDNGTILGNLRYTSPEKLSPTDQQKVQGSYDYHESKKSSGFQRHRERTLAALVVGQVFMRTFALVSLGIIGLLALWLLPLLSENVRKQTEAKMSKNFGNGILLLVLTPFVIIALLFTLIGIPLAVLVGVIYAVVCSLALLPVARLVGAKVMSSASNKSAYLAFIVGLIITEIAVGILKLIPFVGSLVLFLVTAWGVGVIFTAISRMVRGEKMKVKPAESVK